MQRNRFQKLDLLREEILAYVNLAQHQVANARPKYREAKFGSLGWCQQVLAARERCTRPPFEVFCTTRNHRLNECTNIDTYIRLSPYLLLYSCMFLPPQLPYKFLKLGFSLHLPILTPTRRIMHEQPCAQLSNSQLLCVRGSYGRQLATRTVYLQRYTV